MKRSRVRPISRKRASDLDARARCREAVLGRDRSCRGLGRTPVICRVTASEVHELGRGAYRNSCWLDPELCLGMCRACHQWVTEHPLEAQELGLAWPGWMVQQHLDAAR